MAQELSWKEAARVVLQDAKEPMTAQEIVVEIVHRGLHPNTGATPAATVGAQIHVSIKEEGAESPFIRPMPGRFALRGPGQFATSSQAPEDLSEKDPQEGTSQVAGVVNALGMFWERSRVDWKPSQPKLFGCQPNGTIFTDFCGQRGVYLLHDYQGVVYLGRVTDRDLGVRLREHTTDRLNGRWNRFSWFGVYPVTEDGNLNVNADFSKISVNSVIAAMEAVLIEALEPRQNRKRGDVNFEAIEFQQAEDPEIDKKRKLAILEKVTAEVLKGV